MEGVRVDVLPGHRFLLGRGVGAQRPRELGELLVGDESALLGAAGLDRREQLALCVLGEVEPELGGLDADGVDAALLAEDDGALGPTSSDEYGSIEGGSWNWLATAPLSRRKSVSPTSGFHGSSS